MSADNHGHPPWPSFQSAAPKSLGYRAGQGKDYTGTEGVSSFSPLTSCGAWGARLHMELLPLTGVCRAGSAGNSKRPLRPACWAVCAVGTSHSGRRSDPPRTPGRRDRIGCLSCCPSGVESPLPKTSLLPGCHASCLRSRPRLVTGGVLL